MGAFQGRSFPVHERNYLECPQLSVSASVREQGYHSFQECCCESDGRTYRLWRSLNGSPEKKLRWLITQDGGQTGSMTVLLFKRFTLNVYIEYITHIKWHYKYSLRL